MKKILIILLVLVAALLQGCGGGGGGSAETGNNTGENTAESLEYYSGIFGTGQIIFTHDTETNAIAGIVSRNSIADDFSGTISNGQFTVNSVSFDNTLQLSVSVASSGTVSGTWSDSSSSGNITGDKVAVSGNLAPVIKGNPSTSAVVGTSYSFTLYAIDPNGDSVSYTVSNKPSWASFNTSTGVLSGTPTASGIFSDITIYASDDNGGVSNLPAFTINVSDPVTTSAKFSRNSTSEIVTNLTSGLKWQDNSASKTQMSWHDAGAYCSNLNFQGLTDWRLPNRAELLTLVDNTRLQNPYIDVVFVNVPSSFAGYWTSEESSTTNAYYYNFGTTVTMSEYTKTSTLIYVRCVHD